MEKMSMIYETLLSLQAELVLDNALRNFKLTMLYEQIDRALQSRDQAAFIALTNELKQFYSTSPSFNQESPTNKERIV